METLAAKNQFPEFKNYLGAEPTSIMFLHL